MPTITNQENEVSKTSEEVYVVNTDLSNLHKNTLVRLISGVDGDDTVGFHFMPGYKTVCLISHPYSTWLGVKEEHLTLLENYKENDLGLPIERSMQCLAVELNIPGDLIYRQFAAFVCGALGEQDIGKSFVSDDVSDLFEDYIEYDSVQDELYSPVNYDNAFGKHIKRQVIYIHGNEFLQTHIDLFKQRAIEFVYNLNHSLDKKFETLRMVLDNHNLLTEEVIIMEMFMFKKQTIMIDGITI